MIEAKTVTAAILVIGDEILSGRTKDQNIGILADHLSALGIRLREARVVGDEEAAIVRAVCELRSLYTYVFTTGGIGPTHDDITADCVAKALGLPIAVDERAVSLMRPYYDARGINLTGARLRMARIPKGAALIENSVSAAPGFMIENVIVLAGIPETMRAMLKAAAPLLATGEIMYSASVEVDRPEGEIAEIFAAHQEDYPDVLMGSYPSFEEGRYKTELVLRATDQRRLTKVLAALQKKLSNCK